MCGIVGVTESAIARDIDTRVRERRSTGRVEFGLRALGGDRHSPNMQRQLNLKSSSARVSVPFLRPPFCAKMWRSGSSSMAKAVTGKDLRNVGIRSPDRLAPNRVGFDLW